MPTYSETNFEDHIEERLNGSGYRSLSPADYDKYSCLIRGELLRFIQNTQLTKYKRLEREYGTETLEKLLVRIGAQIERRGTLDVVRKGVKDRGCNFNLTYFPPSSGMNPDHQRLYALNRFTLIRQLKYSQRNENRLTWHCSSTVCRW